MTFDKNTVLLCLAPYFCGNGTVCDYLNTPRPCHSITLLLGGHADFIEAEHKISINAGECVFIPMNSKYISFWGGEPGTNYITCHFIFPEGDPITEGKKYDLQPIKVPGVGPLLEELYSLSKEKDKTLLMLSLFYSLSSMVLPQLTYTETLPLSPSVKKAVAYIEQHYNQVLRIEDLAAVSCMSVSRFYDVFRRETGYSPISYKNHFTILESIRLMMADETLTLEQISERIGFDSYSYFRRVFKAQTGSSPREYRKRLAGI